MKYFLRYAFSIIAISVSGFIDAQLPGTAKKWNIQECFQYATEHNIQVNTLRLSEQSSRQELSAARGEKIPSLSASFGNSFTNANNNVPNDEHLVNQLTSNAAYSLNSSVVLWNDHYTRNNIRQQNLLVQSAGLSVQEAQNNITLSITKAFLDILLAKENEKYIIDLVNTTTASVKQSQMLYDAGSIAKINLLQLQAQLASDKYLLVQTQNAIRQNMLALMQILQLPADSSFDIVAPASIEMETPIPSLQQVQQTALNIFPEIKIGKFGVDIAGLDIAKAKAGFKPTLKVSGALGTGYYDVITNNASAKTGYFNQASNNFYQNIGLGLSIPIFSQRINKTNLEKKRIVYGQASLNLQNSQLLLSQAVEQSYLNTVNAKQAYEAAHQQLLSASESYRIVNEQLKLGAINTYDLLQQRNQYVQAVQAFTEAKYTAVLQQKIYEFYMGNPITL